MINFYLTSDAVLHKLRNLILCILWKTNMQLLIFLIFIQQIQCVKTF